MVLPSGLVVPNKIVMPAEHLPGEDYSSSSIGNYSIYTDEDHPYTKNRITGFRWDHTSWMDEETEMEDALPIIWDATTSGVPDSYFLSGIGAGDDLKLEEIVSTLASGMIQAQARRNYIPQVRHGEFFLGSGAHYLHSDDSRIRGITFSGVTPGLEDDFNEIELDFYPKAGVPIKARRWRWDSSKNKYTISLEVRKRATFTGEKDSSDERQLTWNLPSETLYYHLVDRSTQEFIVLASGSDTYPKLIFNGQYSDQVGNISTMNDAELVGFSTGEDSQQFHLEYSPLDKRAPVRVVSYMNESDSWQEHAMVSGFNKTLVDNEVGVDLDLGIVKFPSVASGIVPSAGHSVLASYRKGVEVELESENDSDTISAFEADLNPILYNSSGGFVYATDETELPYSITLSCNLQEISSNIYGPLDSGGIYTTFIATVLDKNGLPVERSNVKFEIVGNQTSGNLSGGSSSVFSLTGKDGKAQTFYFSPKDINEMGEILTSSDMTIDNSPSEPGLTQTTTFRIDSISMGNSTADIYLFKVHNDDPSLGWYDSSLPSSYTEQVKAYYKSYFLAQGIYGPLGIDPASGDVSIGAVDWEDLHRVIWNLSRPHILLHGGFTGKKTLVVEYDSNALNPHIFTDGATVPVEPIEVTQSGDEFDIKYDSSSSSFDTPGTGDTYGYFLVAPIYVGVKASVWNNTLRRYIYSDTIQVKIEIPPHMNGMWAVDTLNSVTLSEISPILASMSGSSLLGKKIPFGFRLRSSTVTLASALGGVTFLDINPLYNEDVSPYTRHKINVSSIT